MRILINSGITSRIFWREFTSRLNIPPKNISILISHKYIVNIFSN
jgi:hypothetical protein